jgi:hypothetical protein
MTDLLSVFRVSKHGNIAKHMKRLSVSLFRRTRETHFSKPLVLNIVSVFQCFTPIGASVARNNRAHHTLPTGGGA